MFCIPVIARDTEEAIKKMSAAGGLADLFEVRLDLMDSFDIHALVRAAGRPVIITYRSEKEGGRGKDSPEKIGDYLVSAIEAGAGFVDVELTMPCGFRDIIRSATGKTEVIISSHITGCTPPAAELERIYRESIAAGGDIVKIVTTAFELEDNLRILGLVNRAKKEDVKIISFCMGPLGMMSRVFSVLMGGYITFASFEYGQESADGQIPIHKMKELAGFFSR